MAKWQILPHGDVFNVIAKAKDEKSLVAAPFIPSTIAAEFYLAWLATGDINTIWPQGRSLENFLLDVRTEGGKVGICVGLADEEETLGVPALAWVNSVRYTQGYAQSVEVAFGMHPSYRETNYGNLAARIALATLFLNLPTLQSAYAEVPIPHKVARWACMRAGMRYSGFLPAASVWGGTVVDSMIYAVRREDALAGLEYSQYSSTMSEEDYGRQERNTEEPGAAAGGDQSDDRIDCDSEQSAGPTAVGGEI